MSSPFQKFVSNGARFSNYSISYNDKSYSFGFSSGFYNQEKIKNFKYVVLFYSDVDNSCAFQFTNEEGADGAFKITHNTNGNSGSVGCRSFIAAHQLHKTEYFGRKKPKKIIDPEFGELWVIKLSGKDDCE